MNINRSLMLLCSVAFLSMPSVAVPGVTVSVDQRVHVARSATAGLLGPGTQVRAGDRITTDHSGFAQIAFPDGTRMVIGPNTMMRIDEYSLGAQGKVRSVRLNATRGNIRFIAGANLASYSVQTPGGTVRPQNGIVDIAAGGARGAYVVTLGGEALMCDAHQRCAIVRGDCTFASANGEGGFGLASKNTRDRRHLLRELFPSIIKQSRLASDFQASVQSCGFLGLQNSLAGDSVISTPTPPGTPGVPTSPSPGHSSGGGGAAAAAASGGGGNGAAAAAAGNAAAAAASGGGSSSGNNSGGAAAAAAAGGGGTNSGGASASASSGPDGGSAAAAASGGAAASASSD